MFIVLGANDEEGYLHWVASGANMPELEKVYVRGTDGYTPIKGVDYFDGEKGDSGVYIGSTPGENDRVWINPDDDEVLDIVTREEVEQIISNIDLDGYATEDYVEAAISEIELTPGKDGYTPIKGVDYFDGEPGKDGYTPVKGVDYFDGKDGVDGKDYILTTADKQEIAGMVEVETPDVDMSKYYTKTEIDGLLSNLPTGEALPSAEGVEF